MRVISGKYRNRKLFFPKNLKTRPLKDSVRENIFNIIEHSKKINVLLKKSNILDLYSGSGSFGLEALSRYASQVIFVEKDQDAFKSLEKNIKNLNLEENTSLFKQDIFDFFENYKISVKFNIVFIDPPYSDNNLKKIFNKIQNKKILDNDYIIITHREKKINSLNFSGDVNIIEKKTYGRSEIFFLKYF